MSSGPWETHIQHLPMYSPLLFSMVNSFNSIFPHHSRLCSMSNSHFSPGQTVKAFIFPRADVSLLRFAWQAWHFVTFRRVLQRGESRLAWQAQYFCDVFRRYVAVFVAGAALWTCPSSFFVAGAALCVSCCVFFVNRRSSLQANVNAVLRLVNLQNGMVLQKLKVPGFVRNARFGAPTCLVSRLWFSRGLAVSMGEAGKHVLAACFKLWKLEEVSYDDFSASRVLSRVSGFPVASPCLCKTSPFRRFPSIMSFCVAGVALRWYSIRGW